MATATHSLVPSTRTQYALHIGKALWAGKAHLLQAAVEVEAIDPQPGPLKDTIKSMQDRGIEVMYGRWLIEGAPRVLLINTGTGYKWMDEWKSDLWASAGIPSPASDGETNEAIVFGYLVAWFLGEVSGCQSPYFMR